VRRIRHIVAATAAAALAATGLVATEIALAPPAVALENGLARIPPMGFNNIFEAEDATVSQGTVDTQHPGFSGSGYVNYLPVAGSYVEWSVPLADSVMVILQFRFANGTAPNRPMDISTNGGPPVPVDFPSTGGWPNWSLATSEPVVLTAGVNTIRATATVPEGGPNVDSLEVVAYLDAAAS
jgi:hypothetical protein